MRNGTGLAVEAADGKPRRLGADAEAQVFLGGLESKLIAAETAGATAGGLALGFAA